ncbi:RNB domain-containing ribonuclease [Microbacterium sp. ASV49]|uniref:RNB domain-containing ribonuclease n=1 Tax=Microbacterium candidum TaxID=3041922 RepID=A0ABT7N363_9MICO|nr:RNB domain-containing ribonuclease [Microbacterium sp. ASV49]MDL9981122.1 RNB domain-containing ribonuclease [Microbacterium sp. ASV49]
MPTRRAHLTPSTSDGSLAASLAALRVSLSIPDSFPADVLAEAQAATDAPPDVDLRDIPFATLDPAGSKDLDQAFQLERNGSGWRVRYAIADVPGFVAPDGAVDAEARRRGQTLYGADGSVPLHPVSLSEDKASLLPGVDRPAFVWTFDLDASGVSTSHRVERALVRSRVQLDYPSTQAALDAGSDSPAALLPEIGRVRVEQEKLRGGASLNLPDEEIVRDSSGGYRIERRRPLPIEDWNAQLSLLTGMAAASLMLDAKVGILRTMPAPSADAESAFRVRTVALGLPWPDGQRYGDYLRGLDREDPQTLAVLQAAASLFRGAGYLAFDGELPGETTQAAVAAPYAHVTAPLRRLVDRWGLVVCAAVSSGSDVPSWARDSLGSVPALMRESSDRSSRLSSGSLNRVEAALLRDRVGQRLTAVVLEVFEGKARVQLTDPVVTASCRVGAAVAAGTEITVTLLSADIATGSVEFSAP